MLHNSTAFRFISSMVISLCFSGCAQFGTTPEAESPTPESVAAEVQEQELENAALQQAILTHQRGDTDAAKVLYKEMLVRYPGNQRAAINLAMVELEAAENTETGKIDLSASKTAIEQAIQLEPNHPQALTIAGVIARKEGRFESSEEYYRRAIAIAPDYLPAIVNLAILLDLYRGELEEALALYERAQSLHKEPDPKLKDWIFDIKRRVGEP